MALENPEYEARFLRIETALEKQAEMHSRLDSKLVLIAEGLLDIIALHKKLEEAQAIMQAAQAKTELMGQETQGRVDALVHVMDNWIREHGGKKNGNGEKPSA